MLKVNGISKKFKKNFALKETSFSLSNGTVGLLGPNGAGKTTLLRLLATYYEPSRGSISLEDMEWGRDTEKIRKNIGYMPQHIGLFPQLKVKEYLRYVGLLRGMEPAQAKKKIKDTLQEVNLEEKAGAKIKSLSGGMKQRLGIAQAIMHEPALLLVDEPTAGLDPEERIRFRQLIKRLSRNRIVIFSTHITEDIMMTCDQVLLMNQGNVVKYENLQEVVEIAEGKVWSLNADMETYSQISERPDVFMSSMKEQQGGSVSLRMVADEYPHPSAYPADPTLEEGYMVWLQGN